LLSAQSPELAERSRQAKELMAQSRFADAVPIYTELVAAVPGNPGLLLNLGMAQHMAGMDREAIGTFDRLLKAHPKTFPALMMAGVSYMRTGQPAKAVPLFERGLALQPSDMQGRRILIDALLSSGRQDKAVPHLRALIRANPNEPRLWYSLGRAYEMLAQQSYELLLARAPESPFTIAITAEARLKQKKLESAFALYRRAAAAQGKVPGVHTALAEIYEQAGHPDWAATERAREPAGACAQTTSLRCLYDKGNHARVIELSKTLRTLEALFWRTKSYNQLALESFRKLASFPPSAELHEVTAELYRSQGRYKESIDAWKQAMALAPAETRLSAELAATLYASRDYAAAEPVLREELKRDPKAPEVNFMLGDALLNQQRAGDAIPFLEVAVKYDPEYLPAHAALGRAYTQTGQSERAVPHLERALAVDTDGALHYQLARAYQATGRTVESEKLLARYKELQAADSASGGITAPEAP
jgi:superkiller protein 3